MESNYRKFGKNEIEWTKSSMNLNGLCNMGEIVCNFGIEWWFWTCELKWFTYVCMVMVVVYHDMCWNFEWNHWIWNGNEVYLNWLNEWIHIGIVWNWNWIVMENFYWDLHYDWNYWFEPKLGTNCDWKIIGHYC